MATHKRNAVTMTITISIPHNGSLVCWLGGDAKMYPLHGTNQDILGYISDI